ncbi:MAG: hypothetical protein JNG84_10045 [Archangium sp.]|nr:hypothetical protein [Archangium sp.]
MALASACTASFGPEGRLFTCETSADCELEGHVCSADQTCRAADALWSVEPEVGYPGSLATVTGLGLEAVTAVLVEGTPAVVARRLDGGLQFIVPARAQSGAVQLVTPGDLRRAEQPFTMKASVPPLLRGGRRLSPPDGGSSNPAFGASLALSANGTELVVGATTDDSSRGCAYVYGVNELGAWEQQSARLVGADRAGDQQYAGTSVALSADGLTALVGANADDANEGAAWVFARAPNSAWRQLGKKLVGERSDVRWPATKGGSVALSASGDHAVLSGPAHLAGAGAVWPFTAKSKASVIEWAPEPLLRGESEDAGVFRQYTRVGLSADGATLVMQGGGPALPARALVFSRVDGAWGAAPSAVIVIGPRASSAVALSGDGRTVAFSTVVDGGVGVAADGGLGPLGAVLVYARDDAGGWALDGPPVTLAPELPFSRAGGYAVALSHAGNRLLVGGGGTASVSATAQVFERADGGWAAYGPVLRIGTGSLTNTNALGFQTAVALSSDGRTAAVGSPIDDNYRGAVWVFGP